MQERYYLHEYILPSGRIPFSLWLNSFRDKNVKVKIRVRLARLRLGYLGDYKNLGEGVFELRIFAGSGYRIYFSIISEKDIVLLIGGDKTTQVRDIIKAKKYLVDFKRRYAH